MRLQKASLYNFAFFGGQRDQCSFDGHYAYITDLKEFVFYKVADYGGLTWVRDNLSQVELSENQYRYAHDAIFDLTKYMRDEDILPKADAETQSYWETFKHYTLHDHRIGANIRHGDKVINLKGKEKPFIVNHTHDIMYINRDHHYKLVDRDVHPPMKTLQEFINKLNSIEKFQGWKLTDLPDKKKLSNLHGNLIVNEAVYKLDQVYSDKGPTTYLITTPGGNTYKNESYISKPFYDQIDLLAGLVYREYMKGDPVHYCIHNVVHDMSTARSMFENGAKHPTNYKQFTEKESYYYNTRMTYL